MEEESILNIPDHRLTPGMKQYKEAKELNPDCIIMLRMGDFYELFYEDAITAAKELDITLTKRGKNEKAAPLAGVPYHALEPYLGKLVKKGYKVAIVEQLEDPKKAKGLVKRGTVRIVTPGTVVDSSMLTENENNYLMSLTIKGDQFAAAFCDLSTGEFFTSSFTSEQNLMNDLIRYQPVECVIPESLKVNVELCEKIEAQNCFVNTIEDYYFKPDKAKGTLLTHFNRGFESFGLNEHPLNLSVSGGLMQYLISTQKNALTHLNKISLRSNNHHMILDSSTFRNLELTKNIRDGTSKGSLLSVLDKTVTSLGARLLRRWIKTPLQSKEAIDKRLDAVGILRKKIIQREEIVTLLKEVYDLERLISRVNYGNASPKDLLALKQSLQQIPLIKIKINFKSPLLQSIGDMPSLNKVKQLIEKSIKEDAPLTIREGGMIKSDYDEELSKLHDIKRNGTKYLQEIELREIEKTGISSLKIRYNRVFGYFIEITKKHLHAVPEHYIRKQTTANSERYITEELKVEEEKILGADEKIKQLEHNLFHKVIKEIAEETEEIQKTAVKIAVLDVLCSLAKVAAEQNYTRPEIVPQNLIHIWKGRHPVVEKMVDRFVTNDIILNENEMMIITGPNMAGKSTVMRQTALIVLMAQMGSFVPAEECVLGICDRIFTRVGAYDDLSSGQSTFMVEMTETASILHNATERSLIILDEIGRGTSTFDGVSIAWSVAEHIYNTLKSKTLFATHYHVMNKLAGKFEKIKNYNIAVKEKEGDIIFLRKLIEGGTDQSYGVHVAKLAGLPHDVLNRAREIQQILEKDDEMMKKIKVKKLQEQKSLGNWG
ncbi:DNA mismatch repair protein MutS [Candidatus Woesearchaeota archaeon]|nr:DNA mismatch repair protein MutS [Candidatus Woesearchaeota archaeon]MBT4151314.1 DNA mismatch repair protein MutS [Candidatus Woesearchaeota archaeon]MBT4247449.1 DNA mismatch repair protein MutS [Candidatus Woesearchaeota archaeon]MBT4434136.1 DNA mismatch repair protein MutS [Candidatus Woesearchaeota archaeon]MBT7332559.1 DNA mismatch repair protein MutS [Candidatus Woesearchaeota archaeon]